MNENRASLSRLWLTVFLLSPMLRAKPDHALQLDCRGLHFVDRADQGYVVKWRQGQDNTGPLTEAFALGVGPPAIKPVADYPRIGVVENPASPGENDAALAKLRADGLIEYGAPLLSCHSEIVALLPAIVVRVVPHTTSAQLTWLCETFDLALRKPMAFTEQEYLLDVLGPDAETVLATTEALHEIDFVQWAAPETAFRPHPCEPVYPNDVRFPDQWHLHNTGQTGGTRDADINAPEAWAITTGDPTVVIAVMDTGIDANHPDLANNLVAGYDFHDDDPHAVPTYNPHGTRVAGIIAGQGDNGCGVAGVTWSCRLMPIRIPLIGDPTRVPQSTLATAFRWAAAHGADVFNNSWGNNAPLPIIHSALVDVTSSGGIGREGKGCVVLAAAGNQQGSLLWPARYPEVIAVGATDANDLCAAFNNYGPEMDLTAPGIDILTTDLSRANGTEAAPVYSPATCRFRGTSAACAMTTGLAALILSVEPSLTNAEVGHILMRSARDLGPPGPDDNFGWGRIDAFAAVTRTLQHRLVNALYVDDDASNDPGPGDPTVSDPHEDGSTAHPYDNLQEAIDNALTGEEIIVQPGRYVGQGNRDIDFAGKAIHLRSVQGPDDCIVDCQGHGRAFAFTQGKGENCILEGLTITGGSTYIGAGVLCQNSSPTIRHCVFVDNAAFVGAAVYVTGDRVLQITHCIFSSNTASWLGGALYTESAHTTLTHCTLARNAAPIGAGVCTSPAGAVELRNCIVWGHASGPIAGQAEVAFSAIQDHWPGPGNIDANPLFADANRRDYHLQSQTGRWDPILQDWVVDTRSSPCIDAGDPDAAAANEPEPNGSRINIGAYGATNQASKSPPRR